MSNFAGLEVEFDWVLGERVLVLRSERLEDLLDFAFTHDIRGVIVNAARGFRLKDLGVVAGRRFVEAMLVCGEFKDLSPLHELPGLRRLTVSYSEAPFDARRIPALEKLSCEWTTGRAGLVEATSLRDLHLRKFKSTTKDLRPLAELRNLEVLDLSHGNFASLAGIEAFPKLRRVELHGLRSLADVQALAATEAPIEFLHMDACSKLVGHEAIQHLRALKILRMHRCGVIPNLDFVRQCHSLQSFRFLETDVADGDLSPLESLADVCFTQKSHFSHRLRDLPGGAE